MPSNTALHPIEPQLTPQPIHPDTRIGHVHLKVADLDRALAFYCGVLGFELKQRYGQQAAFVAAGGYHHHIGLNTWESKGGSPPPRGTTGGLSHGRPLSDARSAGRCSETIDRGRRSPRGRQRSWCEPSSLSA